MKQSVMEKVCDRCGQELTPTEIAECGNLCIEHYREETQREREDRRHPDDRSL